MSCRTRECDLSINNIGQWSNVCRNETSNVTASNYVEPSIQSSDSGSGVGSKRSSGGLIHENVFVRRSKDTETSSE